VNERRAEFNVKAMMGETVIGEGTHQRAIIEVKAFKDRVAKT
jgi:predicted thioesterase